MKEARLDISENRIDHYLLVLRCDNIGIKIRNSGLEIKCRRDVQPYYISKLYISGNIEWWERWEWNDRTNFNEIEQLVFKDDKNLWIRVDKKQWQKKFNVRDNDLISVPSQVLYSDLAMEITELKSKRKSWWTIGFDSFTGQNHSLFDKLIETCPVLHLEVDLKKEWSFGYPRWLSQVII